MKLKRPAAMLCAMAIAAVGVTAAAAGQGSQEDPLLTLSYLDKVLKPQLEAQVDQAVQANEAALAQRLEEAAKGYAQQTGQGGAVAFQTRELAQGERFTPGAGRELLVTAGSATALGTLTDTTAGAALRAGDKLEPDHLYLTVDDAGGCQAAGSATVMSR